MLSETAQIPSLTAMQGANMPRLDWRTMVASGADQLSAEDVAALDTYFQQFIQDDFSENAERKCPCCQSSFGKGGGLVGFLMSGAPGHATLEWGLANGEAFCSHCEYPFRIYHRDVGPIKFLSIGLAYHPDELTTEEHTPDEGEPHPATECESRGCVKLGRSER